MDKDMRSKALRDAMYGEAVGDALGVPYEFLARDTFRCTDMVGYGSHHQPAGTWSDDTSMAVATADSIRELGRIDPADIHDRFADWLYRGRYACGGGTFDVGNTTAQAIRLGHGLAGEWDNGNGSLMRIAPLAFCDATDDEVRAVSAVTHAHELSCGLCVDFVHLLRAAATDPEATHARLAERAAGTPRDAVRSSGFVRHTYDAASWCVGRSECYRDAVLLAVNLGEDTDTTGAVAGALAGTLWGIGGEHGIPQEWLRALRDRDVLEACLF